MSRGRRRKKRSFWPFSSFICGVSRFWSVLKGKSLSGVKRLRRFWCRARRIIWFSCLRTLGIVRIIVGGSRCRWKTCSWLGGLEAGLNAILARLLLINIYFCKGWLWDNSNQITLSIQSHHTHFPKTQPNPPKKTPQILHKPYTSKRNRLPNKWNPRPNPTDQAS